LIQLHDPSDPQVPSFLQGVALHANAGHVPSLSNATFPGQGVSRSSPVIGLPIGPRRFAVISASVMTLFSAMPSLTSFKASNTTVASTIEKKSKKVQTLFS